MSSVATHKLSHDSTSLVRRLVRSAIFWPVPFLIVSALTILWFYRSSTLILFDDPLDATVTSLVASANSELTKENPEQILSLAREPLDPRYQQALSGRYWLIGQIYRDGRILPVRASRSMAGETLNLTPANATALYDNPSEILRARTNGPDNEPLRFTARMAFYRVLKIRPLL